MSGSGVISSFDAVFRPNEHIKKVMQANRKNWNAELCMYSPAIESIHRHMQEGHSVQGSDGKFYKDWQSFKTARLLWLKENPNRVNECK